MDVAKANGSDALAGLIDETTKATPEVRLGFARGCKGESYKTLVRTALPTAAFRNANEGSAISKSVYANRIIECFILNPVISVDKAVADAYEYGGASWIANEADAIMKAAWQTMGRTFYYGRNQWTPSSGGGNAIVQGGDPKGFPGLIDGYNSNLYTLDAGGSTAYTASSVWGVKFGAQNVGWVYGNDGQMTLSDVIQYPIKDANGNTLTVYHQEVLARPGLQIGDIRSVVRIMNVTADADHTLTDDMLFNAIELLPAAMVPDMWLMSRRSLTQLRNNRTTFNPTGQPAPIPATDGAGIPIHLTDSISNYEPISYLPVTQ
ncbi:MAG TPA: hypothetical protein VHY37_07160 [Tepidisphaeraceae bacterium]|nr:hypothetical protein [Tepidisphaeraceae bacterium]